MPFGQDMLWNQGINCFPQWICFYFRGFHQTILIVFIAGKVFPQGDFIWRIICSKGAMLLPKLREKLQVNLFWHIAGWAPCQVADEGPGHAEEIPKKRNGCPGTVGKTEQLPGTEKMTGKNETKLFLLVSVPVSSANQQ